MKKFIWGISFCGVCTIAIISLGGLHYTRFVGYVPEDILPPITAGVPFCLGVTPARALAKHQALIPGLLYIHETIQDNPPLQIRTGRYDWYGYELANSFTVEDLEIIDSSGRVQSLVDPVHALFFKIESTTQQNGVTIGKCSGESITIRAQGHAILLTGSQMKFSESRTWIKKCDTRLVLGILGAE